jgi:ariadne-1
LADHALRHNGIDPNAERNTELAAAREIVDCDEAEHAYKAATQCPICLENRRDSIILTCGHTYCRACLNVQLRQAILAHSTQNLECPGCLIARGNRHRKLEMQEIVRFASRQQAHAAESIITQEFWPTIGYKLCPTAGCPCTFEVNAPQVEPRRCELCTRQYCMQCLLHHDTRITCDQARVEHAMPTGDRAYIQWLRDNTKLCPRCRRNIEKNAGCNHMTCRHSNCGYQFCWVCMGDWNNGAGPCQCYQCGRMPAAPQAH